MDEEREQSWNGERGAPTEPPPDDVLRSESGDPIWDDGPNGPEWLTEPKGS